MITTLIRIIAVIAILFGFGIAFTELYHFITKEHSLDIGNISWAFGIVVGGTLTLQFGNLATALKALIDLLNRLPFANAFKRRSSDTQEAPIPERADGSHESINIRKEE